MTYEPESEWLLQNMPRYFRQMPSRGDEEMSFHGRGVYVDLGAAHPINKSLTHFVRDLGWFGIAVDANRDYSNDWSSAGCLHHFIPRALSAEMQDVRFAVHDNCMTSRVSESPDTDHPERWGIKRLEVLPAITLPHLLHANGIYKIDLLTCDLEGMEARVLRTLDWEKHQPAFVIVEYVTAGEGICCDAANLLIEKGYELIQMFPANLIFRRK